MAQASGFSLTLLLVLMLVVIVGCGDPGSSISKSDIAGVEWQWSELKETQPTGQSVVPDPDNYTLVFQPDGMIDIQADCNLVGGSYTLEDDSLSLELGPSTMAFCGEESLDQQYLASLDNVESASLEDGHLVLHLKDDAGKMVFNNGGPSE